MVSIYSLALTMSAYVSSTLVALISSCYHPLWPYRAAQRPLAPNRTLERPIACYRTVRPCWRPYSADDEHTDEEIIEHDNDQDEENDASDQEMGEVDDLVGKVDSGSGPSETICEVEVVDMSNAVDQDRFLLPSRRNFPAIDLIRIPTTKEYIELFQITSSTNHPINLPKLKGIMEVLEECRGISQFRLIFVVPADLAATYTFQNYLNRDGRVVKNAGDNVTQWVLGL